MLNSTAHIWDHRLDLAVQGTGLAAATGGTVFLVSEAWQDPTALAATLAYSLSLLGMFVCSILNAVVRHPDRRGVIQFLDHAFIYLLIAGTYTPVCLLTLGGWRGFGLLAVVWLAATAGIAQRARYGAGRVSILFYIALGWVGLTQMEIILARLPSGAAALLGVGGVIYTVGAPVHRWTGLRYHDAVWHGSVVAAASCHWGAILLMVGALRGVVTG